MYVTISQRKKQITKDAIIYNYMEEYICHGMSVYVCQYVIDDYHHGSRRWRWRWRWEERKETRGCLLLLRTTKVEETERGFNKKNMGDYERRGNCLYGVTTWKIPLGFAIIYGSVPLMLYVFPRGAVTHSFRV